MAYRERFDDASASIQDDLRTATLWLVIVLLTAIIHSTFDLSTTTSFAIAIWLVATPIVGARLVRRLRNNRGDASV